MVYFKLHKWQFNLYSNYEIILIGKQIFDIQNFYNKENI